MPKCIGCGIELQDKNPNEVGYTPDLKMEYCQRCFRLLHYDDLILSQKEGIDPKKVYKDIKKTPGALFWLVDLFDLEGSLLKDIDSILKRRDVYLIGCKRDLLPDTTKEEKLKRVLKARLKEEGIKVKKIFLTSSLQKTGFEEIWKEIERSKQKQIVVFGRANVGKSTFLNCLLKDDTRTISRYPGTTLECNASEVNGITFADTPGIEMEESMLMVVNEKDLKMLVPRAKIKPRVYQLRGDQSLFLGGLARIDLLGCKRASAVIYLSNDIEIHRGKYETAAERFKKHYGHLYKPTPEKNKFIEKDFIKEKEAIDVVIQGCGWICVHGNVESIHVHAPEKVDVKIRKAMI